MDTTRTTTSTLESTDPTSPGRGSRASAKLTSCPQCAGDVVATPMTRQRDGVRVVVGWACPLHGGPLPLH